ncbi:MAG: site-specific integrase [Planctomycetes bacterium]|nr:site-specific integrase [Planctomycetia bacterium]MBI3466399.1 site-specific integrase [Planctomycetota bacterium]
MRHPKPWFRKFDGWWYVQIGARQVKLARGRESADEAQRRYHELMLENGQAAPEQFRDTTVAHLCDLFLDWSCRNNDPTTYKWYLYFLDRFCLEFGHIRVSALKPFHITCWTRDKSWNSTTQNKVIGCVKRALNWAASEGLIRDNPIRAVRKPPPNRRERILTPDECAAIDKIVRDDAFKNFLFALRQTGCRPGEVAAVVAQDVKLDQGVWVLRRHKTAKRTGRPRIVYLTPPLVELCRELAVQHPDGPIFRNKYGRPWTRNAIRCRFRRLQTKLNLPGVVSYTYRHTFATDGLSRGVPLAMMAELLGHTSTAMLSAHYGHLDQKTGLLREAAKIAAPQASNGDA